MTELGFEPRLSYPWKPQLQVFSAEPQGLPSEASLPGPTRPTGARVLTLCERGMRVYLMSTELSFLLDALIFHA